MKEDLEEKPAQAKKKKTLQKISQISPGEDSARDSGELRGELRNSDHSFWRTQRRTQGTRPLGKKAFPPGYTYLLGTYFKAVKTACR